jgi:hypothetical protein
LLWWYRRFNVDYVLLGVMLNMFLDCDRDSSLAMEIRSQ